MKFLTNFIENLKTKYLTDSVRTRESSESREITPPENRDMKPEKLVMESFHCPYCGSTKFVKRGFRQKKREKSSFIFVLLVTKHLHLTQPKGNIILSLLC